MMLSSINDVALWANSVVLRTNDVALRAKVWYSRADFIAKLEIALKEASETGKWLEMLYKTNYIDAIKYKSIDKICSTIRILLIASIKTAKQNSETSKYFLRRHKSGGFIFVLLIGCKIEVLFEKG